MLTRREILAALLAVPAALKTCLASLTPPAREKPPEKRTRRSFGTMVFDGRSYTIYNHQAAKCRTDWLVGARGPGVGHAQQVVASIETWKEPATAQGVLRVPGRPYYWLWIPELVGSAEDINYLVTRLHDLAHCRNNELLLPMQVRLESAVLTSCGPAYLSQDEKTRTMERVTIQAAGAYVSWLEPATPAMVLANQPDRPFAYQKFVDQLRDAGIDPRRRG